MLRQNRPEPDQQRVIQELGNPTDVAIAALMINLRRGWSMKAEMLAQLVADALMMAVWRRDKPEAVMHHSDRGSQFIYITSLALAGR
ncbi:MAG: hypothetical protein WBX11_19210 [Thiobacillaceae bacterium]